MDVVIQISVLTLSVCVGAIALVRRTATRSDGSIRIEVDRVSSSWLADLRTRSRPE